MNENIRDTVREKAAGLVERQKGTAVGELDNLASALRQAGSSLSDNSGVAGKVVGTIADKVENFGRTLDGKDLGSVMGDVEQFARRNPIAFVGGAVALGFLATRFLKSQVPDTPPQTMDFAAGTTGMNTGGLGGTDVPMNIQSEPELPNTRIGESPMLAGMAALAVGAIFGAMIPETDREHQWFGETRERLKERAATAAREKVAQTIATVTGSDK